MTREADRGLDELLQLIGPLKTPIKYKKIQVASRSPNSTTSQRCRDVISKE